MYIVDFMSNAFAINYLFLSNCSCGIYAKETFCSALLNFKNSWEGILIVYNLKLRIRNRA